MAMKIMNDSEVFMSVTVQSTGDIIEVTEIEGRNRIYNATCKTDSRFNGEAYPWETIRNGKRIKALCIKNDGKCNNIIISDAQFNKLMRNEIKVAHRCWECGCTFYHRPASDGTCGKC